jgi:uncharacterized protein YkwD
MVDALNAVRVRHGVPPLRLSPILERSASAFADHLMRTDTFAHAERIQADGRFRRLGEMLAWVRGMRPRRPAAVRLWLASATHRELLLSPAFRYVGCGRGSGRFRGVRAVSSRRTCEAPRPTA